MLKNVIIVYHLENYLSAAGVCGNQSSIYGAIAPPCTFLKVNVLLRLHRHHGETWRTVIGLIGLLVLIQGQLSVKNESHRC